MVRRTFAEHAGRVDPVISMGQRAYDLAARFWPQLATLSAGVVMSALAYFTAAVRAFGPVVVGGIGIFSGLTAWIGFTLIQFLRIKRVRISAEVAAIKKWNSDVSGINPLDEEFRKQRISVFDLANPMTQQVSNKRFADCELIGPANIVLHSGNCVNSSFNGCDIVVMRDLAFVQNAVVFINAEIYKCSIWKCTVFIPMMAVEQFAAMNGNFVSLSGNKEVDAKEAVIPGPHKL